MGSFVCRGNQTFYEEDGRLYSDSSKRIEYNPNFINPLVVMDRSKKTADIQQDQKIKIEEKIEQPVVENKCDICGFTAKSNAGLAVHRLIHKTTSFMQES